MRYAYVLGAMLLMLSTTGCPTSGTVPPGDAGEDATVGLFNELEGGDAVQPSGDAGCAGMRCISGTALLDPSFSLDCVVSIDAGSVIFIDHASPDCTTWQVDLFDGFPQGNTRPIAAPALIGRDGTWAFDGVAAEGGASSGFYVQETAVFKDDAGSHVVSAVAGPLTLPATGVTLILRPLKAVAYESRVAGGAMSLDWVLAHLVDPATGASIVGDAGVVSVETEAGVQQLAPTTMFGPEPVYYWVYPHPPAAQAVYTITASHPALGDAGFAVQLAADPPAFDGTITSVDAGPNGTLAVNWSPEPQASFEVLEVYAAQGDAGWVATPVYSSPSADPAAQTSETTGSLEAGTYLVNVAYTRASCPGDAGGCVQAATVAAATATVP